MSNENMSYSLEMLEYQIFHLLDNFCYRLEIGYRFIDQIKD